MWNVRACDQAGPLPPTGSALGLEVSDQGSMSHLPVDRPQKQEQEQNLRSSLFKATEVTHSLCKCLKIAHRPWYVEAAIPAGWH